jgi:hypothetical protein
MHITSIPLLGLLAVGTSLAGVAAQEQTGTLKYREHKNFNFVLPEDVWTPAAGGMRVQHPGGGSFVTVKDGVKMAVDTTGDGQTNDVVKGSKGFLRFQSSANGSKFRYAARFKGGNGTYTYQSSCSMSGTVGGVPITLFDLNNNGQFGEVGTDAMIVGKGRAAGYVSKVITHGGNLFKLEVTADGTSATVSPYEGAAGTINLAAGFKARGKLEAVIVSDGNGNTFNVAGRAAVTVPVGDYTIVAGTVKKGSATARIRAGKMDPVQVTADGAARLQWGGPLMAEFSHTLGAGKVTVDPKDLRYYGQAGEEYYGWAPDAKSPKFKVHDPATGREVGGFIFAGC